MLTQEQRSALCEDYKNHEIKVEQIARKYRIQRGEVTRIAVEMGAESRRADYGEKHARTKKRICPKCKKTVDVKGAKFCCFCGSDIRSKKEILIARIEKAFPNISFMPQNVRDEMQQLFIDIINELKEGI